MAYGINTRRNTSGLRKQGLITAFETISRGCVTTHFRGWNNVILQAVFIQLLGEPIWKNKGSLTLLIHGESNWSCCGYLFWSGKEIFFLAWFWQKFRPQFFRVYRIVFRAYYPHKEPRVAICFGLVKKIWRHDLPFHPSYVSNSQPFVVWRHTSSYCICLPNFEAQPPIKSALFECS